MSYQPTTLLISNAFRQNASGTSYHSNPTSSSKVFHNDMHQDYLYDSPSPLDHSFDDDYIPIIKLCPVQCKPEKSHTMKLSIPHQQNRTLSPTLSYKSTAVSSSVKERKNLIVDNLKRVSDIYNQTPQPSDKPSLKTLSYDYRDQNGGLQGSQTYEIAQTLKGSKSSKSISHKVWSDGRMPEQMNHSRKFASFSKDKFYGNDSLGPRMLHMPLEENRSKSSMEVKPIHHTNSLSFSKIHRGSKTPQKNVEPSREYGGHYDKLFKLRGSRIISSKQEQEGVKMSAKDSNPSSIRVKDLNLKDHNNMKENYLKSIQSPAYYRDEGQTLGVKREPVIQAHNALKAVRSMELDSKNEPMLKKGFLSKINGSNYDVMKNYASNKSKTGALNSMIRKEQHHPTSAKHKKNASLGKSSNVIDLVKVDLSRSFITKHKL